MGRERPGVLLARRTEEGMEPDDLLCSRNAQSRTPLVGRAQLRAPPPCQPGSVKEVGLKDSRLRQARETSGQGGTSVLAEQRRGWRLMIFCARATRGLRRPSLDARSGRSISPHPWRDIEQAWREHVYRSMRAVKDSLGCSLQERHEKLEGPRQGYWPVSARRGWMGEKSRLSEQPAMIPERVWNI